MFAHSVKVSPEIGQLSLYIYTSFIQPLPTKDRTTYIPRIHAYIIGMYLNISRQSLNESFSVVFSNHNSLFSAKEIIVFKSWVLFSLHMHIVVHHSYSNAQYTKGDSNLSKQTQYNASSTFYIVSKEAIVQQKKVVYGVPQLESHFKAIQLKCYVSPSYKAALKSHSPSMALHDVRRC